MTSTPTAEPADAPVVPNLIVRVVLDSPLRRSFDYLPPATPIEVGMRVWVPFGTRLRVGIVFHWLINQVSKPRN